MAIESNASPGTEVITLRNSIFPSNSYICVKSGGTECFLVDPGTDPTAIDEALQDRGLAPAYIFLTHGHFDHAGSAAFFQGKYGAKAFMHSADDKTLKACNFLLMAFKIPFKMVVPKVELIESLSLEIDERTLSYIPAPGHTPGSCVVRYGDVFFSGDTLYSRGIGEPRLPGGDPKKLRETLKRLIDIIPVESIVYPGHGEPASFGKILSENKRLMEFVLAGSPQDGGE